MHVTVDLTYKTNKGFESKFTSEEMSAESAIILAEDLQRTGRLKNILFYDNQNHSWTFKELKKFLSEVETEVHNIQLYFDGGFDKESKRSGLGCVVYYEQNGKAFRLRKNRLVTALETNNEAEYTALYFALEQLEGLNVHHLPVHIIGDSQVVINQLMGEWPCMEPTLNTWADRVEEKLNQMGISPEYKLITRKNNQEADQLATQALKELEIESTIKIESNHQHTK